MSDIAIQEKARRELAAQLWRRFTDARERAEREEYAARGMVLLRKRCFSGFGYLSAHDQAGWLAAADLVREKTTAAFLKGRDS